MRGMGGDGGGGGCLVIYVTQTMVNDHSLQYTILRIRILLLMKDKSYLVFPN